LSQIDTLKGIVRAFGLDPEKILTKEALIEPHRTMIVGKDDQHQIDTLLHAFKQKLKQELTETQTISKWYKLQSGNGSMGAAFDLHA